MGASVADVLAFDALPPDTRAMVERIYGPASDGAASEPAIYLAWFYAAVEDMSLMTPDCSEAEARRAIAALKQEPKTAAIARAG